MGAEGIVGHQLGRDLSGNPLIQAASDINGGKFGLFVRRIGRQFPPFAIEVGIFRVGLGTDGNVLTGSHRGRPGDQTGHAGDQDTMGAGPGSGYTKYQAGRGHDAVIGAKDCGA